MPDLSEFALQLLTGLQIGAVFVLVALGLTLIFGTLGIANFAHGALYLIAAYAGLEVAEHLGWGWVFVTVPLGLFVVGVVLERGLIRFFYARPVADQILVTFGLALVVQELARVIFGGTTKTFPAPRWAIVPIDIGIGYYPPWRLLTIGVTIVTVIAIYVLLRFTRFGLVVRAGMRDAEMVRLLGIDITSRFTLVFGFGALLAAIGGLMGGVSYSVNPESGMAMLVPSFLVVVIGGMGSLPGAVIAGLLMGVAQALSVLWWPSVSQVMVYFVAVAVLSWRPRGLFGLRGAHE
ncbi:branched-chain amino acid ABC transporter permease [Desertimonas flava]|jgi:branched-chain amino acid transport system permease protein|uniref:branched-chain amino acid ABC transporter permease n=1 Tax=Desertimonas flava TaxID=2064846 RepID=UPI000E352980|nr:branched-chain amino acid ABC transporter permease [Desertimonas flava]